MATEGRLLPDPNTRSNMQAERCRADTARFERNASFSEEEEAEFVKIVTCRTLASFTANYHSELFMSDK